jgi:hypothetical protein
MSGNGNRKAALASLTQRHRIAWKGGSVILDAQSVRPIALNIASHLDLACHVASGARRAGIQAIV